jgi:hypothetical protein
MITRLRERGSRPRNCAEQSMDIGRVSVAADGGILRGGGN